MTTLIRVLAAPVRPSNGGDSLLPLWLSIPIFLAILGFVLYRTFGSGRK